MRFISVILLLVFAFLGNASPSYSFPVVPPVQASISLSGTVTSGMMGPRYGTATEVRDRREFSGGDVRVILTYSFFPDQIAVPGTAPPNIYLRTDRIETWFDTGEGTVSWEQTWGFDPPADGGTNGGDSWSATWGNQDVQHTALFLHDASGTIIDSDLDPLTNESDWGKFLDEPGDVARGTAVHPYWTEGLSDFPEPNILLASAEFEIKSIEPIPEPGTMLLLGMNLLGFAVWGKKRLAKG